MNEQTAENIAANCGEDYDETNATCDECPLSVRRACAARVAAEAASAWPVGSAPWLAEQSQTPAASAERVSYYNADAATVADYLRQKNASGAHVAAVAVVTATGSEVAIASAAGKGYYPQHQLGSYPKHADAQQLRDEINASAGIPSDDATAVEICSMFRPGEYDVVRATL